MKIDMKISLDDFIPDYSDAFRGAFVHSLAACHCDNKKHAKYKDEKYGWIITDNNMMHSRTRGLGIRPEKLIDWRRLERRYYQINENWKGASTQFWDSLRLLTKPDDRYETWVYIGDDELLRVQRRDSTSACGSYSAACASQIAKSLLENGPARCEQPQRMITYENGGKQIAHLQKKSERLRSSAWKYKSAFCRGVIDRIVAYNKANDPTWETYSYNTRRQTYIVDNDDRQYVFNCSPGKNIELISEDEVIIC